MKTIFGSRLYPKAKGFKGEVRVIVPETGTTTPNVTFCSLMCWPKADPITNKRAISKNDFFMFYFFYDVNVSYFEHSIY